MEATVLCSPERQGDAELIRRAIQGDPDALGELCMAYRQSVTKWVRWRLSKFKLGQHTEDVVQDVFCGVVRSFRRYDPTHAAKFSTWLFAVTRLEILAFLKKNRIMRAEVPLFHEVEGSRGEEQEVCVTDALSLAEWQKATDSDSKPPSQANCFNKRQIGRSTREKMKLRAREKELQLRPGSGNYRRDHRKKTVWELKRIEKERMAWAEASHPAPTEGVICES